MLLLQRMIARGCNFEGTKVLSGAQTVTAQPDENSPGSDRTIVREGRSAGSNRADGATKELRVFVFAVATRSQFNPDSGRFKFAQQLGWKIRVQSPAHLTQQLRSLCGARRRTAVGDEHALHPAQAFGEWPRITDNRPTSDPFPELLQPTRFVQEVRLL